MKLSSGGETWHEGYVTRTNPLEVAFSQDGMGMAWDEVRDLQQAVMQWPFHGARNHSQKHTRIWKHEETTNLKEVKAIIL